MSALDFQTAVIERSRELPVVVDFWAPWCAPCRTLGPIIESLTADDVGRWELVKLNTDEHPEIAGEYGIQGIPAVKLFVDGRVRGEFVGALPKGEIRRFLDDHLPDSRVDELRRIVARWEDRGSALVPELERFVEEDPDRPEARLRLAQAVVAVDPGRARELIRVDTQDAELTELAQDIETLATLVELGAEDRRGGAAEPLRAAARSLARNELSATLDHLVEAATIDREYEDQLARRAAVSLFRLLGHDNESTRAYRRRLATALLS